MSQISWLTKDLREEIRQVFEPRFRRKLADEEVTEIAENLTSFVEHFVMFEKRKKIENSVKI